MLSAESRKAAGWAPASATRQIAESELIDARRINNANQNSYRTRGRPYCHNGARSDVGQSALSAIDLCRSRIFRRDHVADSWADRLNGGSQRFHIRLCRSDYQCSTFKPDLCSRGQSQPRLHHRERANLPDYWPVSGHGNNYPDLPTALATFRPGPRVVGSRPLPTTPAPPFSIIRTVDGSRQLRREPPTQG